MLKELLLLKNSKTSDELLRKIKNNTNTQIEQTKTKPEGILGFE